MKIYKNVLYSLNKAQQSVHSNIQEMYQVVNIVVKIKNQITGDKNPHTKNDENPRNVVFVQV